MLCEFAHNYRHYVGKSGLNPCCNGRCSASVQKDNTVTKTLRVLILVVMEDALRAL